MPKRARSLALLLALAGSLATHGRASTQTSIEYELLALVNGARSGSLIMHTGLVGAARAHSRDMANSGSLSHGGARARVAGATPDPSEANGAPDDGFTGTWCENIAYVNGGTAGEVASRVYSGWKSSATHLHCMTNPGITAVGMGAYFDGETWWVTMEAFGDRTPPSRASTTNPSPEASESRVTPQPGTLAEPVPTEAPREQTPAATLDVRRQAIPIDNEPAGDETPFSWPEIAAGLGIVVVAVVAYRYFSRAVASR